MVILNTVKYIRPNRRILEKFKHFSDHQNYKYNMVSLLTSVSNKYLRFAQRGKHQVKHLAHNGFKLHKCATVNLAHRIKVSQIHWNYFMYPFYEEPIESVRAEGL